MARGPKTRGIAGAGLAMAGAAAGLLLVVSARGGAEPGDVEGRALIGEARRGSVTVSIAPAVDVAVSGAAAAGRPVVVIDPGHGGPGPRAGSVSGGVSGKDLAPAFARGFRGRGIAPGPGRVP